MEFELEDEEKESKIVVHDVVQKDIRRLSCKFQDLNLVELQNVLKGGPRNSLKIEQQIHLSLHSFFFHLSCLGNGIGRRCGLFLNVDSSREFL